MIFEANEWRTKTLGCILIIILPFSNEGSLYWHSEVDDRYVMSFRFWNLLFQLASRMEPGISRFINQFLEHEMLLSAGRKLLSFEKFHGIDQRRRKKWKQTIKSFILCNEIRFSRKKKSSRDQNKEKERKYRVNKQYKPNLFYFELIKLKLATVFHKKGVSCDVVVIKYWEQ